MITENMGNDMEVKKIDLHKAGLSSGDDVIHIGVSDL